MSLIKANAHQVGDYTLTNAGGKLVVNQGTPDTVLNPVATFGLDGLEVDGKPLSGTSGSSLVGYDTGTVQDVLDGAKSLQDYAALRTYTGRAKRVYITGLLATAKPAGIAGTFQYDSTDTTSADNGGTIIVGANGRRWKRDFDGAVNIRWFGAKGDWDGTNGTDDTSAIQAAINFLLSKKTVSNIGVGKLYGPKGNYLVNGTVTVNSVYGFVFEGDGTSATTITRTSDSGNLFSITGYGRVSFRDMCAQHQTTTSYTTWTNVLFNMNGTGGGNHFSIENFETLGFGQIVKYNAAVANEDTNFFSKLRCINFKTFLYVRSSQAVINSIRDSTFAGTCQSVFDMSGFGNTTLDTCNIVVSGKVFDLYSGQSGPQSNYLIRNTKLEHWPNNGVDAIGTTQLIVMNNDMQVSFTFEGGGFLGGIPDQAVKQIVARGTLSQIIFNGGNWDSRLKIECYDSVPATIFGSNPHVKSFIKFKGSAISPTPTNVYYNTTGTGISYMGVVWEDCQDRPNLCLTGLSNGQTYNSTVPSDDLVNKATFTGANSGGNILNGTTATTFPYPHYDQPAFLSKVRVFIYSSGVFANGTIKMFADSAKTIQIGTTQAIPNGAVSAPIIYDLTIPANTIITQGVFVEIANTNGIYAYGRVFIETISI